MIRDPKFWDFVGSNAHAILIFLCALVGGASKFAKGEEPFRIWIYLFEFASSMSAGFIVYYFLKATSTPAEWINAISGLSAYFGTKILTILYQLLLVRLKRATDVKDHEIKINDKNGE